MSLRRQAAVRGWLAALVLGLLALCAVAGRLAERGLVDGRHVELGLLQLRLAYNTGAAFSIGAGLPDGVLLVVTAVITLAVAGYTWRQAPTADWATRLGLAAILAGAVANLVDRAGDGAVVDYLHTGWWPTFNLPDTLITLGGGALVLAALRTTSTTPPTDIAETGESGESGESGETGETGSRASVHTGSSTPTTSRSGVVPAAGPGTSGLSSVPPFRRRRARRAEPRLPKDDVK